VREHQELVFISVGGMVQRTAAGGISQQGRSATGVRVMNLKEDDVVSAIALVVDDEAVEPGELPASGEASANGVTSDVPGGEGPAAAQADDSDGVDDETIGTSEDQ
jgi:DNA gyrase subunit A